MKVCPTCKGEFDNDTEYCPTDGIRLRRKFDPAADPMLQQVLDGRYVIQRKLGEGGMGAVYVATQKSVGRAVAVKTLKKELASSEEFADRFMREVHVATSLNHPHIVTLLDSGQADDGTLFLVMELLEGESLTARLERGPLDIKEALRIGIQVASALETAHAQRIVHRDLKPDNIFMLKMPGDATFAKVLDFGIAKVLEDDKKVTKTGMIFGTPDYMSPEQCKGVGVDHRTDLYALGCILFELLEGRTPFRADTPMAMLLAHVSEPPPRPSSFGVHVPHDIEEYILRLLSKDPAERPQSATDVRLGLEAFLAGNPTLVGVPGRVTVPMPVDASEDAFAATGAMEAVPTRPVPSAPPTASGNGKLMGVAAALGVALLIAVGGVYALMNQDATPEDVPAAAAEQTVPANASNNAEPAQTAAQIEVAADVVAAPQTNQAVPLEVEPKPKTLKSTKAKKTTAAESPVKAETVAAEADPKLPAKEDAKTATAPKTDVKTPTATKADPAVDDTESAESDRLAKFKKKQKTIETDFKKLGKEAEKLGKKADQFGSDLDKMADGWMKD